MSLRFFVISVVIFCCEGADFKFSLSRSQDWQSPGGLVQYSLKMIIPESSPLKTKIKLPFNNTAIIRLTKVKIAEVSPALSYTINYTTLTSSAGNNLHDIAVLDFGEVTRGYSLNDTAIKIEFEVQVMDHQHIVNGGMQWVSVGTEYKNQSVWAAQIAIKTVHPVGSRPDLSVQFFPQSNKHTVLTDAKIFLEVNIKHSPLTTAPVDEGVVEWQKPSFLQYGIITVQNGSVAVAVDDTPNAVLFKFGNLGYAEEVKFVFEVNVDPQNRTADGRIHDCTTYLNVKYNGSAGSCTSPSASREFSTQVSDHFQFYKLQSCDQPLGMEDNTISDGHITASSYSSDGQPHMARLHGGKAWIPSGALAEDKSQFLQVNFTRKTMVRRLRIRGTLTRLLICPSNDGVVYKCLKEKPIANANSGYSQMIVLPIPIEAVYIRLNPTGFNGNISLQVEFYGCALKHDPPALAPLKFTSRSYLLDKTNERMYVCSVPTNSKNGVSKCYRSTNAGSSWAAMDNRVLVILGLDTTEDILYAVALNGKAVLRSTSDHMGSFIGTAQIEWEKAKAKPTTIISRMLENDMAITDDPTSITPQPEHIDTSTNGTKWGVSAKGIHVEESSRWKLTALWMCSDFGE